MIILRLKFGSLTEDRRSAVFVAGDEYAEGFVLTMPAGQWDYLGRAVEVTFVVSIKPLSVSSENEVRELRR